MGLLDFIFPSRRRRRLLAEPMDRSWFGHLEQVAFFETLSRPEQDKLLEDMRILVAEKQWEGCGGQTITDEIRVVIAAQAALLLLNLEGHDYFGRTASILVYPSTFLVPRELYDPDADGTVPVHGDATLGQAQMRGPVVVSWDAALAGALNRDDGRNVVLHEFAHKLDMMDHLADGTPPIRNRALFERWVEVMSREFEALIEDAERGRKTLLDVYGASEPCEFFAVATEAFFEKPRQLGRRHPDLYEVLSDYYGQDPARRARRGA
ncbi:MAG: zinc-dependent peptidase [Phycisphaeraceae bacterium]|nr:zinc-dependent peptidase [Phycisphaeraceae bacterium]